MMRRSNPLSYIRDCLRSDPQIWPYDEESEEDEEETEEMYRTVYVSVESEDKTVAAMLRPNARARDFQKVVNLAIKIDDGDDCCLRDITTGESVIDMPEERFRSIKHFTFGKSESARSTTSSDSLTLHIAKTFAGTLYDGMDSKIVIVRTTKELNDFTSNWILKSHPKFQPGVRKIIGSTPSKDPLLTGKSKIDFDKFSLVFVFGQRTVAEVSRSGQNLFVYWRYDWTKRTSNGYGAALVPRIPSGLQVNLRWMLIAPPLSSGRIGLRPMSSSHPIRRRVRGPPMTQDFLNARRKRMRLPGRKSEPAAGPRTSSSKQKPRRRSARIAALKRREHR